MDAVPIRTARRGDLPSLVLLATAMLEENARLDPRLSLHPDAKEHVTRSLATWIENAAHVVLVAEEGGRLVVGFAAGSVTPGNGIQGPTRIGQITDCFVVAARRRKGIARRLADRVMDLLTEKGVETIRLQVAARNAQSIAFWESLGLEPLEDILERPISTSGGGI